MRKQLHLRLCCSQSSLRASDIVFRFALAHLPHDDGNRFDLALEIV
jgi:hypothetical protein